jgi:hypothetical protein
MRPQGRQLAGVCQIVGATHLRKSVSTRPDLSARPVTIVTTATSQLPIVTIVTASCVTFTPDNDTGNGQLLVALNGPLAAHTTFKWWDLIG